MKRGDEGPGPDLRRSPGLCSQPRRQAQPLIWIHYPASIPHLRCIPFYSRTRIGEILVKYDPGRQIASV
jgi:hypothetical protein